MTNAIDTQERIDKCQKILASDPSSQIFAALAEAYRRQGDLDKAFRTCQGGLKIHSEYGPAHAVMAKINLDRRMYDWAESEARKAAEIDGWARSTELLLAEIHIYKGEFDPAIRLLKRLLESDPGNDQITKLLEIAQQLPQQQAEEQNRSSRTLQDEPTLVSVSERAAEESKAAPPPEELTADSVLDQSIGIPGLDGVLYVNREGLLISSRWSIDGVADDYAAAMTEISGLLDRELAVDCWGQVTTVLVESDRRTFYLVRQPKGMFVFVVGDAANLGGLRMRLESLLSRLSQ